LSVHLGGNHFFRRTDYDPTILTVENNLYFNGTKRS